MVGLTEEIVAELRRVMNTLKVPAELIAMANLRDTREVNRILQAAGADMYLLCTVGSWGDTISDEEVLADLRRWNQGHSLEPEVRFRKVE